MVLVVVVKLGIRSPLHNMSEVNVKSSACCLAYVSNHECPMSRTKNFKVKVAGNSSEVWEEVLLGVATPAMNREINKSVIGEESEESRGRVYNHNRYKKIFICYCSTLQPTNYILLL